MTKQEAELSPQEVLRLINMEKICVGDHIHSTGERAFTIDITSENGRESFQLDYHRGNIELKYTMQTRYKVAYNLLRFDIGSSKRHTNPTEEITLDPSDPFYGVHEKCIGRVFETKEPHVHIYREGFADKWAYPPETMFSDMRNVSSTFNEFMDMCNITKRPYIYNGMETYESDG